MAEAKQAARESIYERCKERAREHLPPPDLYSVEDVEAAMENIDGYFTTLSVGIEHLFAKRLRSV